MRLDPGQIEVVSDEMAEVYRRMTPAERWAVACGMFSSARRMILSHLRTEHPNWDDCRIREEAARRLSHGAI